MAHTEVLARTSFKGGFYLFLGKTASLILLALNTILIGRLLGPEDYGLYTIVFIVPTFLITLSDLGISAGLVRFTAHFRSQGKSGLALKFIKTGILIKIITVISVSVILILSSTQISIYFLNRPGIDALIRLASIYLVGQALIFTLNAIFLGLDEMGKSSLMITVQSMTTLVSSVILINLGMGVTGAVLGSCIGTVIGTLSGGILYITKSSIDLGKNNAQEYDILSTQTIRTILEYSSPLYFTHIITALKLQIQRITLTLYNSNTEIGNYHTAINFAYLIITIGSSITDSLFPSFSKLNIEENRESLENMFKISVKYSSLVVIPASMALLALSKNVVYVMYGPKYVTAPFYLAIYLLIYLSTGFGGLVLGVFFSSQAETMINFKISLINLVSLIPPILILVPRFGVIGLITSLIIAQYLSTFFGLYLIKRMYGFKIEWSSSRNIIAASMLSALIVHIFNYISPLNSTYNLMFGGTLFLMSFLLFAPVLRAIKEEDLDTFNSLVTEIPIINPLIKFVLKQERRIMILSARMRS